MLVPGTLIMIMVPGTNRFSKRKIDKFNLFRGL
jgi:hypothetical protein